MFSGEDSSGEGVNALNPFGKFQLASQSAAACGLKTTTTSSGSIDWASLAQQWILMRDFSGADINTSMPDAPPPPNISGSYPNENKSNGSKTQSMKVSSISKRTKFDEQGEADMEMDDEEDGARIEDKNIQPQPNVNATQILQPNWFISQAATTSTGNDIDAHPHKQASSQWNPWPPRVLLPPVPLLRETSNPTAHIPSLMKINIPDPNMSQNKIVSENHNEMNSIATMDAAKRKILPAWIREGLEKMEREKQKQLEKQQQNPIDSTVDASFDGHSEHSNQHMVINKVLTHLESDNSSCYEEEDDNDRVLTIATAAHITKIVDSPLPSNIVENLLTQKDPLITGKSYEQKLSDLMILVRKTLTELLLEVTNQEISNVANETLKSHKTKATTAHVIPKSAISTITGKLGLAAYDDSSSDTSESVALESINNDDCIDSEEEIRASIRTKRKAFSKTSEEIEEQISESALQEEQKLKYYLQQDEEQQKLQKQIEQESQLELERAKTSSYSSKGPTTYTSGKGYEKEFGETSQSKLQLSNGKRQKDRTTRFSDNKDSRGATIVTAADYISHYKCSQIETAAQKINSVVLHTPADGSNRTSTEITSRSIDAAASSAFPTVQGSLGKPSRGKSYKKKHRKSSNHSSDNNDSSSDDLDSSETSNSSHSSSKHSRSSSLKHKSHQDQISSSSSTKMSNRDRYYYGPKSSSRRYRSSDSDNYYEDKHYSSRKYHKHRSSHRRDYHHERKSERSRSRSRSRSSYSSSRRRH